MIVQLFTILDIFTSILQAPSFADVLFSSSKHLDHTGDGCGDDKVNPGNTIFISKLSLFQEQRRHQSALECRCRLCEIATPATFSPL
jgi:hypothetical protein